MQLLAQNSGGDGGVILVLILVGIALFTIATLVQVLTVPDGVRLRSGSKAIWTIAILFTGVLGAALYYAAGSPQREEPTHLVHKDPRAEWPYWWCENCSFTARGAGEARVHGRVASMSRMYDGDTAARTHDVLLDDQRSVYWCRNCNFESPNVEAAKAHRDGVEPAEPLPAEPHATAPPTPSSPPPTVSSDAFKTCPDCAEEVRAAARKCRFCGYIFEPAPTSSSSMWG